MLIKMIGRGTYYKEIVEACDLVRRGNFDLLVNYGLQGTRLDRITEMHPEWFDDHEVFNHYQYGNKYEVVKAIKEVAPIFNIESRFSSGFQLIVPESHRHRRNIEHLENVLAKPYYSLGGRSICRLEDYDGPSNTHYFQEQVMDRKYELRVHAFNWMNPDSYLCQKRIHPDGNNQLTWNHHTGGSFETVEEPLRYNVFKEAQKISSFILKKLGYQFAALDYIITHDYNIWFIEANLAPGFTMDVTRDAYITAFHSLKEIPVTEIPRLLYREPVLDEINVQDACDDIFRSSSEPEDASYSINNETREAIGVALREIMEKVNEIAHAVGLEYGIDR